MTKMVKIGDHVAFNRLSDATWFEVTEIDGFMLTIREENTKYAEQRIDKSLVAQLRSR